VNLGAVSDGLTRVFEIFVRDSVFSNGFWKIFSNFFFNYFFEFFYATLQAKKINALRGYEKINALTIHLKAGYNHSFKSGLISVFDSLSLNLGSTVCGSWRT
jgi:hypothetical protein